ncbi:MAG TPA: alpha/beta fold hydrolase [Fimbriimonas sp.]|nr:alpha/beta fold hydrolase [Fimbriimonas sp.]
MAPVRTSLVLLGLIAASFAFGEGEQRFAEIGNLRLQSGAILKDCRVGYRTFGKLDAERDNAVLVPTWYLGTTNDLKGSFGADGLADSSKYYVIAVDALTNGVSTSPSNSKSQHDAVFPEVTIRDMVESQHRMLLGLGIRHLRAVMGISMGGIQTFQWITAYPDFMDKAVPIVGSPRPTSYDLMFYSGGLNAFKQAIAHKDAREALIKTYADFFWLNLNTPAYYVRHTKREEAIASLAGFEKALLAWDPYDAAAGLSALMTQDIFKGFDENEEKTAAAVHAKVLVIVASQDHCVNPAPALSFAKLLGAETIVLNDDAGHSSPGAEMGKVSPAIDRFLAP